MKIVINSALSVFMLLFSFTGFTQNQDTKTGPPHSHRGKFSSRTRLYNRSHPNLISNKLLPMNEINEVSSDIEDLSAKQGNPVLNG